MKTMSGRAFVAFVVLLLSDLALAQDVLIRGATVHTVSDRGVLENASGELEAVPAGEAVPVEPGRAEGADR